MPDEKREVIVIERGEGCDCPQLDISRMEVWQGAPHGGFDCPHGSRVYRAPDIPADLAAEALFGQSAFDDMGRMEFMADNLAWRMQNPEDSDAFDRFVGAEIRVREAQEKRACGTTE